MNNQKTRHFKIRWLLINVAFIVSGALVQTAISSDWSPWIQWGLLLLLGIFGTMVLMPVFQRAMQQDRELERHMPTIGNKYSRFIENGHNVLPIASKWAEENKYKVHDLSTESKIVYFRKPRGLMPIFVTLEKVNANVNLEAWISTPRGVAVAPTSKFSLSIPNRIAVKEVNDLLSQLNQAPIT